MKPTFWYKFAANVAYVLHVLGASALVQVVLALFGVDISFWIGVLSAVPGWLIVQGLITLANHEQRKMQESFLEAHAWILERLKKEIEAEEEPDEQEEECRFHKDGQCTFGDGAPECAKEKDHDA